MLENAELLFKSDKLYGSCVRDGLYILTDNENKVNAIDCNLCKMACYQYIDKSILICLEKDSVTEENTIKIDREFSVKKFNINHFIENVNIDLENNNIKEINDFTIVLTYYMKKFRIDVLEFPDNWFRIMKHFNSITSDFYGILNLKLNSDKLNIHDFMNEINVLIYKEYSPNHLYLTPFF